jgi:hypothetical protein
VWAEHTKESVSLIGHAISFLERQGTLEEYLAPRREALERWQRVLTS